VGKTMKQRVRPRLRSASSGVARKHNGHAGRQSKTLLETLNGAALFHAPDQTAYADIKVSGHRETWKVRSAGFRDWLSSIYYRKTGEAPNNTAIEQALRNAEARAKFGGVERPVCIRVGSDNGSIYLDLADLDWRAVRIDGGGWNVVRRPKVKFVRTKGMLALPMPVRGGSIGRLRDFINVKADEDFILVAAWLLSAMRDHGPYPVLMTIGEQGSAKSTLLEILRSLVDPNVAPLRSPPRDYRDLFIAASNAHVLAYDNLSGLPSWLSDGLARISTGAAHATRQLYADQDEAFMKAEKPIALNGITDIVSRADLADRCIFVVAERILDKDRKPKQDLMTDFEAERPRIFGALLDAVATGIAMLPKVASEDWPRMADFAKWGMACESAYTTPGLFRTAYQRNVVEAVESMLDDDLVAAAVQKLRLPWEGPARKMLEELNSITGQVHVNAKDWPKEANALSARLRRLAPLLRSKGINAEKLPRTSARRGWRLAPVTTPDSASRPSLPAVQDKITTATANAVTVNGGDDRDMNDEKSGGLSSVCAKPALSDMDAAYEELRMRGDVATQRNQLFANPKRR
jgi:hypothetical protein